MRRCFPIALLVLAIAWPGWADEPVLRDSKPADAGMSADVLKKAVALFEKAAADDDVRGAVLLVARHGKIVVHEAIGWRNKDDKQPMRKDTIFHIASNTKPIVAAGILLLVEEGKLELDAPVGKYLPSFDNGKSKDIKVRHLLTHTSGFRIPTVFLEPLLKMSEEHPDAPTLRLEVDRFGPIGPKEKPGATYSYNNPGYNTLGALIEVAAKQPLDKFLGERFYRPLGMADAYHLDRPDMVERRSLIYEKKDDGWKINYKPGDPPKYPFVRGSGGLLTTAADYARFLHMFLNEGSHDGKRILKPETVRLAIQPHTRSIYSDEERKKMKTYYGFGWNVDVNGSFGHGGSDGTSAWVEPTLGLIGIVFTQSPKGKNPREEFRKLVQQAVEQP